MNATVLGYYLIELCDFVPIFIPSGSLDILFAFQRPPSLNRSRSPERRLPQTPDHRKAWNVSSSPESIPLSPKKIVSKPEAMVQAMKVRNMNGVC